MKKLLAAALLIVLPQLATAQTVTCSVSGLSAKQTALLADFLANVNAQRAAAGEAPFADFSAYCRNLVVQSVVSYAQQQEQVNAGKVAAAAVANGDQTAPNAQCTAAGLANGCLKSQVACFVLTGNTACTLQ